MDHFYLSRDEVSKTNALSQEIMEAVAEIIDKQPYLSCDTLECAVARFVAAVMKLNYDIWSYHGGCERLVGLIYREWGRLMDQEIDYGIAGKA